MLSDRELDAFGQTLEVPEHRQLFDYWRSKAKPGKLPARKDIDPIEIPNLLPWLSLIEVDWSQETPRFRFRVVGTGVVERFGLDVTGLWFEDAYDAAHYQEQMATYTGVAATARPFVSHLVPPIPDREHISCRRLILPMTGESERIERVISAVSFQDRRIKK